MNQGDLKACSTAKSIPENSSGFPISFEAIMIIKKYDRRLTFDCGVWFEYGDQLSNVRNFQKAAEKAEKAKMSKKFHFLQHNKNLETLREILSDIGCDGEGGDIHHTSALVSPPTLHHDKAHHVPPGQLVNISTIRIPTEFVGRG